jgi:hypothetical protein
MPTAAQLQTVSDGVSAVRAAQTALLAASRGTNDPTELGQISNEYNYLQSILVQLAQAQVISDDNTFQQATTVLNQEAAGLNAQAAAINGIVSDAQLAGQIAGYIAQAAAALAAI